MTDKLTYLTPEGLAKIKEELTYLKTKRSRELADRIDAAKALGDLSENAEYHEAKDALGMVMGRVREIEEMLKNVSVIEPGGGGETVEVGTTVTVEVNGKSREYTIVGSSEADPIAGRISNESPIGQAFMGHKVGDSVSVETPAGNVVYAIKKIA